MIDTRFGEARLLEFLPDQQLPTASFLELTGDSSYANPNFRSGLTERVAKAWVTPLADLSCGQCRMLVGQRLGLQWIAVPIAVFVTRYPTAECDLYPGDLTTNALRAWREMHRHAPVETEQMIAVDFDWLIKEAAADEVGSIIRDAVTSLELARANLPSPKGRRFD